MTDIVERLRNEGKSRHPYTTADDPLLMSAADEIERLRAALAQQRGEPVAWYLPQDGYDSMFRDHATIVACTENKWEGWIPLYTAPQQPQDLLRRARNMLSHPPGWRDTPSNAESRYALSSEIAQHLNEIDYDEPENRCGGPGCDGKCCQPVDEPVAWRSKVRINGEFDSGWHLTSTEPPQTPRTIAIEPLYAHPPQQRRPLSDAFVSQVVRSVQPNLSATCKAWAEQFDECKYWLDAAHEIGEPT